MVFRVCVKCMHAFFCNKAPIYLYSCPYMCHKCKISSGNTAGFSINAEVINNLKLGWEIWSIFTCRLKQDISIYTICYMMIQYFTEFIMFPIRCIHSLFEKKCLNNNNIQYATGEAQGRRNFTSVSNLLSAQNVVPPRCCFSLHAIFGLRTRSMYMSMLLCTFYQMFQSRRFFLILDAPYETKGVHLQ